MNKKRMFVLMTLVCVSHVKANLFALTATAGASEVILTAAADTYLFKNSETLSYGARDIVAVRNDSTNTQHGLLRFDLSGLEPDIIIKSVTLRMQKTAMYSGANVALHVYELSAANTNWVEGSKTGVSETGAASWGQKAYAQTGWAGSAGASTAGTDYLTDVLATDRDFTLGVKDFTGTAAFAAAVSNNLGGALNLLLMLDPDSTSTGKPFVYASKENAGGQVVPTLVIEYAEGEQFFEVDAATWITAPPEVLQNSAFKTRGSGPVLLTTVSLQQIDPHAPASISSQSEFCRWENLPLFPTIMNRRIGLSDWSGAQSLEFTVHSEAATGCLVTLALLSNSDQTAWKDYYLFDFSLDWEGWKTFRVPLSLFTEYEQPAGWSKIDGIHFFSKMYNRQPNPAAVLHLGGFAIGDGPGDAALAQASSEEQPDTGFFYTVVPQHQKKPRNHLFPELAAGVDNRFSTIEHQPYFRAERALYGYYPRFDPGYVSLSPQGKTFVFSGDRIQWRSAEGLWEESLLRPVLTDWARTKGWAGLNNRSDRAESAVRFDQDGDAYVLVHCEPLDTAGKPIDWMLRTALLLHSTDGLKTWTVYQLPGRLARFEKIDGHNLDALKRPPVILLGDYKYFKDADQAGYILIPEKQSDGTLRLPEPVQYASNCLSLDYHSGDANIAITQGEKVYIAFGWVPPPAIMDHTKWGRDLGLLDVSGIHLEYGFSDYQAFTTDYSRNPSKYPDIDLSDPENWGWSHVDAMQYGLPPIPVNHPGLGLVYQSSFPQVGYGFSKNGIPTFVVEYDIKTRTVGTPVYIGSGGRTLDVHNWPAMTLDSAGRLHVLINGHGEPPVYTHTLNPQDISSWTDPAYALRDDVNNPAVDDIGSYSYATLNCDRSDTLHVVMRLQGFGLIAYRKPLDQPWQRTGVVMKKFRPGYTIMNQKMTYDPGSDRLFLTYYSHGALKQLSLDEYHFLPFIWPDLEKKNPGPSSGITYYRGLRYSELIVLVSADHGETWSLGVTDDFVQNTDPASP